MLKWHARDAALLATLAAAGTASSPQVRRSCVQRVRILSARAAIHGWAVAAALVAAPLALRHLQLGAMLLRAAADVSFIQHA